MKWIALLIGLLLSVVALQAQDIVRYQDPWYLFHNYVSLEYINHPYGSAHDSFMGHVHNMQRYYTADSNLVVYGIAVTANAFPLEEDRYDQSPAMCLFKQTASGNPPSIEFVDSAHVSTNPWKSCLFEYNIEGEPSGSHRVPCHEFYFHTPHTIASMSDTFFVSVFWTISEFRNYNAWVERHLHDDGEWHFYPYIACTSGIPDEWCLTYESNPTTIQPRNYESYYRCNNTHSILWGCIFPIVGLRCVAPTNFQLVERGYRSATVKWQQYDTPERYQLSIGPVGIEPDSGTMVTTTDTFYTFTDLEPDTRYMVWVRKACRYITASYDTLVWSDWSSPTGFFALGMDEVEADGVRITSQRGSILVEGAEGRDVRVYDMLGRPVGDHALPAGIYMVRVGNLPTRKVAVIR